MGKMRIAVAALIVALLVGPGAAEARRYASIVVDGRTGTVLHADNPDRWVYPASLTKMMTLYMVFEALDRGDLALDQRLVVSRHAQSMPPSELGLRRGDRIRLRDAMMALVTKSANDAAVVIAEAIGGTESGFARLMTRRARELGLGATTFRNASGLPDSRQRTTARDMARLALRLQRDYPDHYDAFATRSFSYAGRTYRNHNRLLESYPGTDGIKTGYIRASGFNLVASVERDGRRLVGVVIGGRTSRTRNAHMIELLDEAFAVAERRVAAWRVSPSPRRPADGAALAARAGPAIAAPRRRPGTTAAVAGVEGEGDAAFGGPLRVLVRPAQAIELLEAETGGAGAIRPVYGVQVGAYRNADDAHRAAAAVDRLAPLVLADAAVEVSSVPREDATLYRARRMGLSAAAADAVCDALARAGRPCFVVRREGLHTRIVDRDAS
ncbi:MAG: D-alanyl-D-alanine carboxypeptidase [Alphaproteobacteria bacterium]|jgi:D-alanyl-D-alanine carboxypeptidase|nr:D-alanyl-D-alanine carboxypeptidase [Alphaproteobacteria bacterium]